VRLAGGSLDSEEGTVQTRMVEASNLGSSLGARSDATAQSSTMRTPTLIATPVDALLMDEIGRVRLFAILMIALGSFGALIIPFVGGDPLARRVYFATLLTVAVAYGGLLVITRNPLRYTERLVGLCAQVAATASSGMLFFFGVFSPAAMVTSLALYVYATGASLGWTLAAYLHVAIAHAVLAGLSISGVIADRGLVSGDDIEQRHAIVILLAVQFVYLMSWAVGRMARKKTLEAITDLETATREVAERDALLNEARAELARAEIVGGPGRFTDQQLGSYRLGNLIGRGGMGEVYDARHVRTDAEAAVKLLHRAAMSNSDHIRRFLREATMISSLDTAHVVKVLEVADLDEPMPYLAMELLRGEDLAHVLRRRQRLDIHQVIDLVRQVGRGLAVAKQAGIVHRDLKPQNLFGTRRGDGPRTWKILDFGVSKLADTTGTLTKGNVVGTPSYMAPEQARGQDVDFRADLYSLAAIAYRCLTGRPAYSGGDIPQLLYKVVHTMPPQPTKIAGDMSVDLDLVLAIGLAKTPRDRFQTAEALADALAGVARGELPEPVRKRGDHLLARLPWGASVK